MGSTEIKLDDDESIMTASGYYARVADNLGAMLDLMGARPTDALSARDCETVAGTIGQAIGTLNMLALVLNEEPAPELLDGYAIWAAEHDDAVILTDTEVASVRRFLEAQRA